MVNTGKKKSLTFECFENQLEGSVVEGGIARLYHEAFTATG